MDCIKQLKIIRLAEGPCTLNELPLMKDLLSAIKSIHYVLKTIPVLVTYKMKTHG